MKTLLTIFLSLSMLVLSGCATWQSDGGKTLATVAVTVDSAMKGWATYCATHDVPQDEHGAVRSAYQRYQIAMRGASLAYSAAVKVGDKGTWQEAKAAVLAAKDSIIQLVQQFTHKPVEAQ